jgi:hypothetical protein
MKSSPFLGRVTSFPEGDVSWKRERLIVRCGSNISVACPIILRHGNVDVFYLSMDSDGNELLNINFVGADGLPVLQMRDNNWKILKKVRDLDCRTSGGEIRIKEKEKSQYLSITFRTVKTVDIRELMIDALWNAPEETKKEIGFENREILPTGLQAMLHGIEDQVKSEEAIYCEITGKLEHPYLIHMLGHKTKAKKGMLSFCSSINCGVGFGF